MGSISLERVAKSFNDFLALQDVSLDIADGEFVVFVGPSGCGKSTLLRLIAGLEEVSSGRVRLDGVDVTNQQPGQRGLAMVFQSYALYPHMTVRQNMAFPLKIGKVPAAEARRKVGAAARALDLTSLLDRRPKALSGGQRQRVAIGRAIVREPKAFLFDEPLSNLDAELRVAMRLELTELHRQLTTTMIYVTHDQVEAMTMADRIVVMNKGKVEQFGTPLDLYRKPINRFVAGFIGSPKMNFIETEMAAKRGAHCLGIRPEHLRLTAAAGEEVLTGTVRIAEQLGADTFLHVDTGGPRLVTVRTDGGRSFGHDDTVHLVPDPENIHLFDGHGSAIR